MKRKEKICECPNQECERHGDCERCEAYHAKKEKVPFCRREKEKG